ncbi:MAG: hypothetical protein M1503_06990 [Thaumarchaeota archaeon]|nr:hypothetical protein [Nitrososphaerota archaeon]MCL5317987.1 hypothetical protein [Nitrososphaerota archaeon]
MQRQSSEMQTFVKDREIEHLLSPVKILVKQNLPKISTASIQIEETKEGDLIEVPRWVAEVFADLGFAQIQEEVFEVEMLKTLSRERIQGPNQLSTITGDFYLRLRRYLDALKEGSYPKGASKQSYEEAHMKAIDLITMRTVKLLPLTVGDSASDLVQKVTPEEMQLYNIVRKVVQQWKQTILEGVEDEE